MSNFFLKFLILYVITQHVSLLALALLVICLEFINLEIGHRVFKMPFPIYKEEEKMEF